RVHGVADEIALRVDKSDIQLSRRRNHQPSCVVCHERIVPQIGYFNDGASRLLERREDDVVAAGDEVASGRINLSSLYGHFADAKCGVVDGKLNIAQDVALVEIQK